jgi:hypothetical protein
VASTGWQVVHPEEFWESGRAYIADIRAQVHSLPDHQNLYYELPDYEEYADQFIGLATMIAELSSGKIDPISLPSATDWQFLDESSTILSPLNLLRPDYRRLTFKSFSAFYRLNHSDTPPVCFGVRIFLNTSEPEDVEAALEFQFQQIMKRLRG